MSESNIRSEEKEANIYRDSSHSSEGSSESLSESSSEGGLYDSFDSIYDTSEGLYSSNCSDVLVPEISINRLMSSWNTRVNKIAINSYSYRQQRQERGGR